MEKQPAEQGLKTRGLAIGTRIPIARTSTRPIAAAANQVDFVLTQEALQPAQGLGLGTSLDHLHHLSVQQLGLGRKTTPQQPLVQFPNGIPQPGQLERAQVSTRRCRFKTV
jgi:hypothetical protein